ncbi:26S proteasome non-atpase regulatory subunit [Musa troglodytarum]|uniref:26S proteasome non-ATPase regulatory subunit 4 homolog n=1 Tax=Musa troglodytarum TaxID=320322 RepID=A0A9E7KWZ5_9LILI|nr:26S proteasome non-atpase regulatory subunit [Musa troglodytarum]
MVLEATMICIDNSEWMRNGDYAPSRFQAQADAINLICGAKTQSNPENTVGILTMAGNGVRVLVTPTSDLGKILSCTHGLVVGGEVNMTAAIQVAQLALKHRQNKKQQQRIIVFAGSPITYDNKTLEAIGRKLKKNSVALDVVNFGESDDGKPEKLEALITAVNNNDSSHIVHVPAGQNALSDVLISGFAAAAAAAAGAGGPSEFDFGVDPNVDPEMALALRISMEEERARQEAAAKRAAEQAAEQEKVREQASSSVMIPWLNQLAIQLLWLMRKDIIWRATDMSIQSEMSKVLEDQSFVSSILNSLPGVDPNDPSLKDLLASLQGESEPRQKQKEDEQEEEDHDE